MKALYCDLYALNMVQAYLDNGMTDEAVFEFFVRRLPPGRNFLMAAGLAQVAEFLDGLAIVPDEMRWLRESGRFKGNFLDYMENFRFSGDVDAMPRARSSSPTNRWCASPPPCPRPNSSRRA